MNKNVWRCRCGKRAEILTDDNFGDCGCSDPVYGLEYFYMSEECAGMLDEMDKDYSEARAEIERLKDKNTTSISAHMWAIMRHAFIDGAHKGYAHGTEYKLLTQMFAEWCSKNYPDAADNEVKRLTEIERKDKLIEQLREALKNECLNHCEERFSRDCPPNDCRDCKTKAALEAAERGEG